MAGESKHIGWQQILFSLTTWWCHWLHHRKISDFATLVMVMVYCFIWLSQQAEGS